MIRVFLTLFLAACSDTSAPTKNTPTDAAPPRLILSNDSAAENEPDVHVLEWEPREADAEVDAAVLVCSGGERRDCDLSASGLVGQCAVGTQFCNENAWGACSPQGGPRQETCDGLDNDCDGMSDEHPRRPGEPLTMSCYTQERNLTKQGQCQPGVRVCGQLPDGSYGFPEECTGQVLPGPEICDGIDNDCNGLVDDMGGLGAVCTSVEGREVQGLCSLGVMACVEGNDAPLCSGEIFPERELCDELDNDCDGRVDENLGRCDCENPLFVPRPETCNGVDDDCDGIVDNEGNGLNVRLSTMCFTNAEGVLVPVENAEDFPQMSPPCVGGRALCEQNNEGNNGYFRCEGEVRPGRERCNGLDDDCDGNADEGFEEGNAIVVFGIDISGSMEDHEIETAVEVADRALQRLAGNPDICYLITVIGHEDEPILVPPGNGCLPAVGNNGINAREALRNVTNRNWAQNSMDEGTWDLIYDVAIDDRDIDNDFLLENVTWTTDAQNLNVGVDVDFRNVTHRVVIIIGDEEGQTNRGLTQQDVAEQVHASGTLVYVISPYASVESAVDNILPSYTELLPQANGQCSTSPGRGYCDYFYPIVRGRLGQARRDQIEEIEASMEEVMGDLECIGPPEEMPEGGAPP